MQYKHNNKKTILGLPWLPYTKSSENFGPINHKQHNASEQILSR